MLHQLSHVSKFASHARVLCGPYGRIYEGTGRLSGVYDGSRRERYPRVYSVGGPGHQVQLPSHQLHSLVGFAGNGRKNKDMGNLIKLTALVGVT